MIYKIKGKYYIKIGEHFREIELVFENGDVDLKPIGTFLEHTPDMIVEEINFMEEKDKLIKEHENKKSKSFKSDLI